MWHDQDYITYLRVLQLDRTVKKISQRNITCTNTIDQSMTIVCHIRASTRTHRSCRSDKLADGEHSMLDLRTIITSWWELATSLVCFEGDRRGFWTPFSFRLFSEGFCDWTSDFTRFLNNSSAWCNGTSPTEPSLSDSAACTNAT